MTMQEKAVETAIRNGEKMHGKYEVIPMQFVSGSYFVQHKEDTDRTYIVNANKTRERCQCDFFAKWGTCKHQWFVAETLKIEAGEAMAQAQAEEEGRCPVCGTHWLFPGSTCERCEKRTI